MYVCMYQQDLTKTKSELKSLDKLEQHGHFLNKPKINLFIHQHHNTKEIVQLTSGLRNVFVHYFSFLNTLHRSIRFLNPS